MDDGYGIESPGKHVDTPHRRPTRYLVVIDSAGMTLARFFLDDHEQIGEVDAGAEEVAQMTRGLQPTRSASGPEWDRALRGHSVAERGAADVYTFGD